ncbi:MAG: hypothetical protein U5O39_10540 [Gammaproteobacteria bacterium]|nr:hypothetical protein [Gammaproteobacteria bacterium]
MARNESIFDFLSRMDASKHLLDLIVDLEKKKKLPHRTLGDLLADKDSALDRYFEMLGFTGNELSELESILDQVIPPDSPVWEPQTTRPDGSEVVSQTSHWVFSAPARKHGGNRGHAT